MISVIILIRQFRYCYRLTTEGVWYRSSFWSDSSDTVIDLQQRVYDIGHHSDPTVPILLYTYNRGCMISVIIQIRQFRYCYILTTEGVWYRSSFRSDSSDTVIDLQQRVYDIGHHSDPYSSDTVIDLQQRVYDIGHHSDPTVPILLYTYNRGCMISVIIQIRQFRYCYRLTTQGVWYRSSFWSYSSDTVIDLQQRVCDIGHHSDPTVPILL